MFTITVPTKDRPQMLQRALKSILAQDYKQFEILVFDDGDGAGVACAAAMGDPRIIAFSSGHAGQVGARNQAIGKAKGRWIAWLDDDDWWEDTGHLTRFAHVLEQDDALTFASGTAVWEAADGREVERIAFTARTDAVSIRKDNMLLSSGIAYPRALHEKFGAFDASLPVYWDWDWYLRLIGAGIPARHSGGAGVCISCRTNNVSSGGNQDLRRADLARFAGKHGLTGLVLKNHEEIARSEGGGRGQA